MNLLNVILSTHYISNEAYFKSFPMLYGWMKSEFAIFQNIFYILKNI